MGANGQSVALVGWMGAKALVVIDGTAPKALSAGDSHMGVRLVSVADGSAVLDIEGRRSTVRMGEGPVRVGAKVGGGAPGGATKIVLPLGTGGHFFSQGMINGRPIQFMVDTGATLVALGKSDALRLGIDISQGKPVSIGTANGRAMALQVKLASVRIGEVELYDIDALVGPDMPMALLGNSFLSRFSMTRQSDLMVLERRY